MPLPRRKLVLLATALLAAGTASSHAQTNPTATVTITGGETTSTNGVPDSGSLTVAINGINGYAETISYGQFSSQAAIASGLAAKFSHDYIRYGLYAKAGANNNTDPATITFQFTGGQTFNSINYSGPSSSFGFNPIGFPAINPTPTPPNITLSFPQGPATMGVIISGTNIGISSQNNTITFGGTTVTGTWTGGQIIIQVPSNAPLGLANVVLTVNGQASNAAQFTVIPAFTCPPTSP